MALHTSKSRDKLVKCTTYVQDDDMFYQVDQGCFFLDASCTNHDGFQQELFVISVFPQHQHHKQLDSDFRCFSSCSKVNSIDANPYPVAVIFLSVTLLTSTTWRGLAEKTLLINETFWLVTKDGLALWASLFLLQKKVWDCQEYTRKFVAEIVPRCHKINNNLHIIKRQKILKYTLQNTQELCIRALCMQSVEPWRAAVPVVRALQLPIFAPSHDYNDEDDES